MSSSLVKKFNWSAEKHKAATMLADGRLSQAQIAQACKVAPSTLCHWKDYPEFTDYVNEIREDNARRLEHLAFADKEKRIKVLEELALRGLQVIAERAADPEMQMAPGGSTGLLARDLKSIGVGQNQQVVITYRTDVGLLREIRDALKQVAQETGQWSEKVQHSGEVLIRNYGVSTDSV